jgi:hypothetical protein
LLLTTCATSTGALSAQIRPPCSRTVTVLAKQALRDSLTCRQTRSLVRRAHCGTPCRTSPIR